MAAAPAPGGGGGGGWGPLGGGGAPSTPAISCAICKIKTIF